MMEYEASATISKDFKTVYGYTPDLKKKYGSGVFFKSDKSIKTPQDDYIQYRHEALKRTDLYITVLKSAFNQGNGGNSFIAVKTETLEGLKDEVSKQNVLNGLKPLSANIYDLDWIKNDKTKFEFEKVGRLTKTLNGTVLSVKVDEFKDDEAVVEVTSWFGNLGAFFSKYKADFKNGKWQLKLISMSES